MSKQNRKPNGFRPAPIMPRNGAQAARPSAPARPAEPTKHQLDAMQSMAVRLMVAREAVKAKNAFIAKLQANNGKRAKQDAERIGALEVENADLTQQLMQTLINVENADNARLAAEFKLPAGAVNYKQDADGSFFYEEAAAPPIPQVPDQAPVETPEERRTMLMAELAELDADGPDADVTEVPSQDAKA
jgi:hypothetical protein